jgi:RNA polymerase sigma-70 factor (sigma-E family)
MATFMIALIVGTVGDVSVGGDHAVRGSVPGVNAETVRGPSDLRPDDAACHDDAEFRDYVTARNAPLLRMAVILTGNRADAEDLVQAALAKTYLNWHRIQDRAALDGYVHRAMVNTHISWWRRRRVEEYPTDDIPERAVDDCTSDSALQDAVRRALDRLPRRMRAAVVLRYFEDMTEAEVAGVLGVSVGTVKSTVSRAVTKLRADDDLKAIFEELVPRPADGDAAAVAELSPSRRRSRSVRTA